MSVTIDKAWNQMAPLAMAATIEDRRTRQRLLEILAAAGWEVTREEAAVAGVVLTEKEKTV